MSKEMHGRIVWMWRARGFKDFDEYETVKDFEVQCLGHSIHALRTARGGGVLDLQARAMVAYYFDSESQ